LAVFDNNFNAGRSQKHSIKKYQNKLSVKSHFRISYRKPNKKFVARKFYETKSYAYMNKMLVDCRRNAWKNVKSQVKPNKIRMAPTERDRDGLIRLFHKYSRFK